MAKSRGLRSIALFTREGAEVLSQPLHSSAGQWRGEERVGEEKGERGEHPEIRQPASSELFCHSCQTALTNREEQVIHYRLDWHRYNLKRKLKGQPPVDQEEFERVAGDLSSISGSESSTDVSDGEEDTPPVPHAPTGSPFVYFTTGDGTVHAVYKSILSSHKASLSGTTLVELLGSLREPQVWIILMRSGGHFAGAVFKGSSVLAHKTFHRYTVRAKRGTAQSVRDAQQGGHQPKSGGASLRRYNEAALEQEIRDLVASWSGYTEEAAAIFIRTPKYSKGMFMGGKGALFSKDDRRLRPIPFTTRRPTLKEVKSAHGRLAAIYVGFSPEAITERSPKLQRRVEMVSSKFDQVADDLAVRCDGVCEHSCENLGALETPTDLQGCVVIDGGDVEGEGGKGRGRRKKKRKGVKEKTSRDIEGISPEVQQLLKVCEFGEEEEALIKLLQGLGLSPIHTRTSPSPPSAMSPSDCTTTGQPDSSHVNSDVHGNTGNHSNNAVLNSLHSGQTMLHIAAQCGRGNMVQVLLQYGADPVIRDSSGRSPYCLAREKAVRDVFRRFMAQFPTAYDYAAAQVPSPLTEEKERERREKAAEKKRERRKAKKQREKEEQELASSHRAHEGAVASLSEREKRALAAERRMAHQLPTDSAIQRAGVCSWCGASLGGVVPFERLQYKYCTMNCLKEHRTQLNKK